MKETVEAVFENGVFRPLQPTEIPEGQQVRLTVETESSSPAQELLEQARKVYAGLAPAEVEEIERIASDRSHFFRQ